MIGSTLTVALLAGTLLGGEERGSSSAGPWHGRMTQAVERGLRVIERGARAYPAHETCFSCHHQALSLLALTAARDGGIDVEEGLIPELRDFTRASFRERQARLARGEPVGGRAATVAYGLWAFELAEPTPDDLTQTLASYLIQTQNPNGSWSPPSHRPPLESSPLSCTVLALSGLRYSRSADATSAIQRGRRWLDQADCHEQEDFNFALWGQAQIQTESPQVARLRDQIVRLRNADGGWSQIPSRNSDAYATGQTLYLLVETGFNPDEAVVREGVAFLLDTQQDEGSWHIPSRSKPIQPWFDNGDPHGKDQFISFAGTGWATAALARVLRASSHDERPGTR